jgi:periplasmic divalent cation tolerance protein
MSYCQLWLTCANESEADKIAEALLAKKLIACARQVPVSSKFRWQGKIEKANEVMLVMESRLDLFEQVEKEVKQLHSYESFVLEATAVRLVSAKASKWLKEELND